MMPLDILLADFAPRIQDGDLVIGESTRQHQEILLLVEKGELRQHPLSGVGIRNEMLDDNPAAVRAEVKRQFELDGMRILELKGSAARLNIEAVYDE